MATKRIYTVCDNKAGTTRLVRASHPNAALMHVARSAWGVRVATQTDLEQEFKAGTKVEEAGEKADASEGAQQ